MLPPQSRLNVEVVLAGRENVGVSKETNFQKLLTLKAIIPSADQACHLKSDLPEERKGDEERLRRQ